MAQDHNRSNDPRIRAALQNALDRGETAVSVAAYYRGKLIVEASAGQKDPATKEPADAQTMYGIFSVSKGISSLAVHILVDRGLLRLTDRIAQYWPEFGVNGKEAITVEHVLSHRSGIPQMPADVTPERMADWDWMVQQIVQFTPIHEPGTGNAYHSLVWGWVVGELVRRVDPKHRLMDAFLSDELFAPLGIARDVFYGVPDSELPRVATLCGGNELFFEDKYGVLPMAVYPGSDVHNLRVVRQTIDPGAGVIGTATAIARVFAMIAEGGTLDGVRILSPERVRDLTRLREGAHDKELVIPVPTWFGAAGFWLGGEPGVSDPLVGDHRDVVYSPGAGGSIGWADLRDHIAVAICHSNMDVPMLREPEPIWAPLGRAIREIIAEQ